MKTVLFLVNHEVVIYNFRYELVEALIKDGYRVVISSPNGERIKELINLGCEYVESKIARHGTNPLTDFKLTLDYIKLLKKVKPDVVFSYTIKPNVYGGLACELLRIPYAVNITGLGTAVENDSLLQKFIVMLYKVVFRAAHTVFLQNEENMQFFIDRKIAMGKHDLLPGSGVNLKKFSYIEYPENDVTKFVLLSRIMKEKGIDQYLEAAEYIKNKYPNTEFHICGYKEAEYEGKLQEYVDKGIVIYHGMVMDVREILKDTHCTIHPTYYPEGISNVLLESAACGRPLITTDRSGCRELIDDGVNGFICKQKDSQDLIEKIEKFLALSFEERKQMGVKGREKVEREFDRQIVIDRYMKIAEEI